MKLTIDRNELWRGIDTVLDIVPSKPALPVLSNLLLSAEADRLSLAATNLDLSIRTGIPASVHQQGKITVPARTFAEIAREWPDAELTIEVRDEHLLISGKLDAAEGSEGTYSLAGMPADEFPGMPTSLSGFSIDFSASEGLDAQLLSKMINKTGFAVSRDETRPVLNGLLWRLDGEGVEMVATDGSRLARYYQKVDLKNQVEDEESAEVIMPPHACSHLVKLLGGQHEPVKLVVGESQVFFDLGETHLLSRLIEGPYVDFTQVIPQHNDKRLQISTEFLLPAVRRVSILSSSYTHQVRMTLNGNSLELSATSQEIGGEAREVVPALYDQEEVEIGYNALYLMEILRKMDSQEVFFDLNNSVTATLLRPVEQEEGEDYFCLLMPLRPSG
jgi:DNA polymerase-3 subunit beta